MCWLSPRRGADGGDGRLSCEHADKQCLPQDRRQRLIIRLGFWVGAKDISQANSSMLRASHMHGFFLKTSG